MVDPVSPPTGGGGKKQGLNPRIGFAIAAGAIGSSFQHGYNTGVLNAPEGLIKNWTKSYVCPDVLNETIYDKGKMELGSEALEEWESLNTACDTSVTFIWSFVVAIFCIGGMMGGSVVGLVSSRLGRKGGLLLNNILVVISALLMGAAKAAGSYHMLILGRLIIGINAGLNAGLAPMYLAEISPTSLRGALGTVYQLIITMSILLSQVLGMGSLLGTPEGWPWLLAVTAVPAIFQIATLPFCPESPKYLLLDKDDEHGAEEALQWLRGTIEVHDEMDEMKQEQESMKLVPKVTLKEMLVNSSLRKPLIIAMMMMLAQQLSGINCAMFYSTSIFSTAGLNPSQSQSATLGMGAMNVAMTFVSLALIEKAGRKVLMVSGLSLMFCMTILLLASLLTFEEVPMMSYVAIVAVITFVVGFATGPGSIPWFFVTELFAQSGRPTATSIAVVVNWTANFLVGLGFLPMRLLMGPWVFMVFIVIQLFFIVYVAVVVPETKGRQIDEITALFRK
jgi:SP family facilitated glucose transporter-like MFS transporter 1